MTIKDFKTTKQKVKYLLETYPIARDHDSILCTSYWRFETGKDMSDVNVIELFSLIETNNATPQSTILRARRKINQEYPSTRGKFYKSRKERASEIRGSINN